MAQNHATGTPLEVDAAADTDTAYNESIGTESYVSSLASSMKNYKYENGRRYHGYREGTYITPNDKDEQDQIDLLHHIYRLLLGGPPHLAPIGKNPQRVLDLGTGTGIWAIEVAEAAPNCAFEIDDFESDWVYKNKFDFIHGREPEGCVADEERLFRQAFQNLKPGGYLEWVGAYAWFYSDDGTGAKAEYTQKWLKLFHEAAGKFSKSFETAPTWKEKMEKVGFVDVKQIVFKLSDDLAPQIHKHASGDCN